MLKESINNLQGGTGLNTHMEMLNVKGRKDKLFYETRVMYLR